jgi:HSP20 family protein
MSLLRSTVTRIPSLLSDFFDEPFTSTVADWFGNRVWLTRQPRVNIDEKEGEYNIELAAPGMQKEDFHVTCEDGMLTIKAEKEERKVEKDKNYTRREYNYNSFSRIFTLPQNVKSDEVNARYENGVLKLTVPKKKKTASTPKQEIKVA